MEVITEVKAGKEIGERSVIRLKVDRVQLSKRRWRAVAEDQTEFGFNLEVPISDQCYFYETREKVYQIEQCKESVFFIEYQEIRESAKIGWMIGNLHFPASFEQDGLLVQDDLAVRQMLDRNHIPFEEQMRVFSPQTNVSEHHHHH